MGTRVQIAIQVKASFLRRNKNHLIKQKRKKKQQINSNNIHD